MGKRVSGKKGSLFNHVLTRTELPPGITVGGHTHGHSEDTAEDHRNQQLIKGERTFPSGRSTSHFSSVTDSPYPLER
jgi:hypothetical protein